MLRAAQSAKCLGPRNTTWAKCSLPLPMRFKLLALIQLMQLRLTRVISKPPPGCGTASGAFGRSQGLATDLRGLFFFSSRHFGNKIVVLSSPLSSPVVLVNPKIKCLTIGCGDARLGLKCLVSFRLARASRRRTKISNSS